MKVSFRLLRDCLEADLSHVPDVGILSAKSKALKASLFSKLVTEKANDADDLALRKFLEANRLCREFVLKKESMLDDHLIGEFKAELDRFWRLNYIDGLATHPSDFLRYGRVGPGASLGANGTDHYSKLFASKLTTTSAYLYEMYRRYCDSLPILSHAERARESDYGRFSIVEGNRLYFVPKKNEISRTICVEPSLNLYFQMGFKHILEARLQQVYNIDLRNQPFKNRELAKRGSLTGHLATIDLSSASDTISIGMLRACLPREWFSLLMAIRSPKVTLPDGRSEMLHMISSMGNAFTFPLETIIFRAVLSAATRVHGKQIDERDLAVFGDDIICPTEIVGKVLRLLTLLGFLVNADKTFVEGPFRESCGHDYYLGHDVRPVYIKSLDSQQDRYVAINLLNAWTAKSGIPLPLTVLCLLSSVGKYFVPPDSNGDAGILVPRAYLNESKVRYDNNGSIRYRSWRVKPNLLRLDFSRRKIRGFKSRSLTWNPFGLLDSFLRGYVRDESISTRHSKIDYLAKWCVSPNWGHIPADSFLGGLLHSLRKEDLERHWNRAVYLNFQLR